MKFKLFFLVLVVVLTTLAATPIAASPLHAAALRDLFAGPCTPGGTYDSACDVNHDGAVNVLDVQLAAGHWNQTGTWTGGGDGWSLTGNAGTNPATNYIGTTDGQPLAIQPSGGNVGVGTSTPNARFNVVGTSWFQGDSTPLPLDAGKGIAIGFSGEQGYIYGFDYTTWTHKNLIVQHDGGKVAIGTSTPDAAKLTVAAGAGETGVYVRSAGYDGLYIYSAGYDGLNVTGSNYAGSFYGNIYVSGNCIGCLQANFAVNAGDRALQPGDVVSILAVTTTDFDTGPVLWQVTRAQPGLAVVGVVTGRAELVVEEEHRPTETGKRLVPHEGAAQPGEYVTIVYSGPMQVKTTDPITAGEKLSIDDDGNARGLRKTEVNGVLVAEGAPVLGIALSESQDGLVWVLVNPQ